MVLSFSPVLSQCKAERITAIIVFLGEECLAKGMPKEVRTKLLIIKYLE
jgi:hypothetical protein